MSSPTSRRRGSQWRSGNHSSSRRGRPQAQTIHTEDAQPNEYVRNPLHVLPRILSTASRGARGALRGKDSRSRGRGRGRGRGGSGGNEGRQTGTVARDGRPREQHYWNPSMDTNGVPSGPKAWQNGRSRGTNRLKNDKGKDPVPTAPRAFRAAEFRERAVPAVEVPLSAKDKEPSHPPYKRQRLDGPSSLTPSAEPPPLLPHLLYPSPAVEVVGSLPSPQSLEDLGFMDFGDSLSEPLSSSSLANSVQHPLPPGPPHKRRRPDDLGDRPCPLYLSQPLQPPPPTPPADPPSPSPSRSASLPIKVEDDKGDPLALLSPSPEPPARRLVRAAAQRFALPPECARGALGWAENRERWAKGEGRRLKRLGLQVTRMFIREDGLVIDWESPRPVWSDTLLPPDNHSNLSTVIEEAYTVHDDEPLSSSHNRVFSHQPTSESIPSAPSTSKKRKSGAPEGTFRSHSASLQATYPSPIRLETPDTTPSFSAPPPTTVRPALSPDPHTQPTSLPPAAPSPVLTPFSARSSPTVALPTDHAAAPSSVRSSPAAAATASPRSSLRGTPLPSPRLRTLPGAKGFVGRDGPNTASGPSLSPEDSQAHPGEDRQVEASAIGHTSSPGSALLYSDTIEAMENDALLFLRRYILTFDKDRTKLAGAYAPNATFSCSVHEYGPSTGPDSLWTEIGLFAFGIAGGWRAGGTSGPPQVSSGVEQGRPAILATLRTLGPVRFCPTPSAAGAGGLELQYDLVHLPPAHGQVGGGGNGGATVLLVCYASVRHGGARAEVKWDQRFVLRRGGGEPEHVDGESVDQDWPLVAVCHQMTIRKVPWLEQAPTDTLGIR